MNTLINDAGTIVLTDAENVVLTPSQSRYYSYRERGYGIRETARRCGVSAATVSRTLKTADRKINEFLKGRETI